MEIKTHKSPFEGATNEQPYTTAFPYNDTKAARSYAEYVISKNGTASIYRRGSDLYVYSNILVDKSEWRKHAYAKVNS